jgi:hypothetical protein
MAVFLALWAWGAAPVFSQTYRFVTLGKGFPGTIRVFEVTAQGDLTEVQTITTDGADIRFAVDPFGRYLIVPRAVPGELSAAIDVLGIDLDGNLSLASAYSRVGWSFDTQILSVSADGKFFQIDSNDSPTVIRNVFIEIFRVNDALELKEIPSRILIDQEILGGPLNHPGFITFGDGYRLLTANLGPRVQVLPINASGQISAPIQTIPVAEISTSGWAVRPDQRLAVVGRMGPDLLTSYAITDEGLLSQVDTFNFNELGGLSADFITGHPSGLGILDATTPALIKISASGEFTDPAIFFPGAVGVSPRTGVSPDGKIAVAFWNVDAQGPHFGVFSLEPFGEVTLIRDHILNISFTDLQFLPFQTADMLGDANGDGVRDVADVVTLVNHLDGTRSIRGPVPLARADADQDGGIDEGDLEWLVEFLLGIRMATDAHRFTQIEDR